jgi:hypothetical protein
VAGGGEEPATRRLPDGKGTSRMAGILWVILVVLLVLWLLGLIASVGGSLIHLLLVIALVVLVFNLVTGRRAV